MDEKILRDFYPERMKILHDQIVEMADQINGLIMVLDRARAALNAANAVLPHLPEETHNNVTTRGAEEAVEKTLKYIDKNCIFETVH